MDLDIAQVVDAGYACARCGASHSWRPAARAMERQYSQIQRFQCEDCGEQIVVKVVGGRFAPETARANARKEYESLCKLQSVFPQDDQYGTLVPLAHLVSGGRGVVITRFAAGVDFMRHIRTLDTAGVLSACRSAGIWLKKLHEGDVQVQQKYVGATEKIAFLKDRYGAALIGDPTTDLAFAQLVDQAARIDSAPVYAVRHHGDFKPDNLLCDGTRFIGLDIHWRSLGSVAYDLAPFLNHFWIDGRGLNGPTTGQLYDTAESAFLSAYGNPGDMHILRWVQLYFALCYMGEYRQRGRLAAIYGKWKARPLVQQLAMQVRDGGP